MLKPRFSIRLKLTVGALLPLFVTMLVCSLVGVYIINSRIVTQAQNKVRIDMNSARELYQNEIAHVRDVVRFTANAPFASDAITARDSSEMQAHLTALRLNEQLDILAAVDGNGRVLFRSRNPKVSGDSRLHDPIIARALKGEVVAGTEVLTPDQLRKEGEDLYAQADIQVVPTPRARPSSKERVQSGMLLTAAAPVRDSTGTIVGALYGSVLLNRNNALVDRIKSIVFEGEQFQGEDIGTSTIFLDDLRITTNVKTLNGQRAIGTLLSEEVYNRVNLNKERWVDRAFVVKDWYFTAYEPILDLNGAVVGSLYVGMLEKPYAAIKKRVNLIFCVVLLIGTLIGIIISGYIGKKLAEPIRLLQNQAKNFSAGMRGIPIRVTSGDEIGDLASEFNHMTETIIQRETENSELNQMLERKVQERTAELEEKNLLLIKTQEELVRAEKLAAVGELAAGVAHEINNPMAIIRGNAELLQMAIDTKHPSREEVDTIAQQVGRVERIVASLLKFARQESKQVVRVDVRVLLDDILVQVRHQVSLEGILVDKRYDPYLPVIDGDPGHLRQVFTNLVLNAIQSMTAGGTLTVVASNGEIGCEVVITDTGSGIPEAIMDQIFNPFFTTRETGTGLGLAVSYGIIKDHFGTISVESNAGEGTTFKVNLPLSQSPPCQKQPWDQS